MGKAQEFVKTLCGDVKEGGGGKGKKRSVTITVEEYNSKKCSHYCEYFKESTSKEVDLSFCNLLGEHIRGNRRPTCIKVFGV
jgi:hypothetical protein